VIYAVRGVSWFIQIPTDMHPDSYQQRNAKAQSSARMCIPVDKRERKSDVSLWHQTTLTHAIGMNVYMCEFVFLTSRTRSKGIDLENIERRQARKTTQENQEERMHIFEDSWHPTQKGKNNV
jgi:hypothetical protein